MQMQRTNQRAVFNLLAASNSIFGNASTQRLIVPAMTYTPSRNFMTLKGTGMDCREKRENKRLMEQSTRMFRTSTPLNFPRRPSGPTEGRDFYEELGVPKGSSSGDIKKAYFQMAKKYHPDVNGTPEAKEKFTRVNTAYETLSDDGKRRVYD